MNISKEFLSVSFILLFIVLCVVLVSLHLYTGLPFFFFVIFIIATYLPPKQAMIVNACIGICSDILFGSLYGFHMMFYVMTTFILILYKRKFSSRTLRYIYFFIVPLLFIYQKLFASTSSWGILAFILGSIYVLQRFYRKRTKDYHTKIHL